MGKDTMIERKRKDLILPWLLIVLAVITILITTLLFLDVESRRAYSNPGNLSAAVIIIGTFIAAPLLIIGIYFVGRNTRFNDRINEISLSMKLEELRRLDMPTSAPVNVQRNPPPIVEPELSLNQEMGMVMHCPECGMRLEGGKFCKHCGAKLG